MRLEVLLRWVARSWGVASALLLLAFTFGGREHLRFTADEAIAFLLFPIGVMVGFAFAWWRDMAGGLITVGSLALFYLYEFAFGNRWLGPYFILFAAPGFLHVASALLATHNRRRAETANSDGWRGGPGDGNGDPIAAPDPDRISGSRNV